MVTGSRIRGAPVSSPVIALSREQMQEEGKADLGDVVRSIPQSFGGGQNLGLGSNIPTASGGDVGDEQALTEDIIALAKQYGGYGYRRATALHVPCGMDGKP